MSENELSENLDKQGFSPDFKNESSSSDDENKVKTKSKGSIKERE